MNLNIFKKLLNLRYNSSFKILLFSLVLISIGACSTVKVETRDFIISDEDLIAKKQKVPTKDLGRVNNQTIQMYAQTRLTSDK